eukprot:2828762-Pleurochrysis_carterae.AAC.1
MTRLVDTPRILLGIPSRKGIDSRTKQLLCAVRLRACVKAELFDERLRQPPLFRSRSHSSTRHPPTPRGSPLPPPSLAPLAATGLFLPPSRAYTSAARTSPTRQAHIADSSIARR